ncbi:MAG: hypothetical protein H3C34_29460 [Caldilineaceae bacterium]|nr:hypothetical protein [Caldilineaceae bacterium]
MSESNQQCQAMTKSGNQCKNRARPGSNYCHVHRQAAATEAPDLTAFASQVNQIADELRKETPAYEPPPYSPQAMLALLRQGVGRAASAVHVPLLQELRQNLEGTTPQDLVDPDTWKGLWYIMNYTAQAQSRQALEKFEERLAALPGGQVLLDLKSGLEGASPRDLFDINTWRGALVILDATVRAQVSELARKVTGDTKD